MADVLMPRRTVVAVVLASVVAAVPATAQADPTITGTLQTPDKVIQAGDTTLLYYLQLKTGPLEERFSVRFDPPKFATLGTVDEGQSIDGPRAVALQGEGTLGQLVQDPVFQAPCSVRDERFHGYATGPASVDVLLPPNTATTLAVRYRAGRRPPWVDSDFRMRFTVQAKLVGEYDAASPFALGSTVNREQRKTTLGPKPGGRTGAHLLLSTTPKGTPDDTGSPRRVSRSTKVKVSGRLVPAIANRTVVLETAKGTGALRTLRRVKTNRLGRFTTTWQPKTTGTHELWARYPQQPGGLTSDRTSCPLRFSVR